MDSSLVTPQSGSSSFWKTKDGKFGLVVSAVLGGLALWGLYLVLPFLISLASNLLTLALLVLGLFVIAYAVLDKDVRTFVFYFYKTIIRAFRRLLVNTDPVSIIEVYISHLKKQFDTLEEKIQDMVLNIWESLWKINTATTIIFVTHDIPEAVYLGTDIYIMQSNPGKIVHHIPIDLPFDKSRQVKRSPKFVQYVYDIEDKMMQLSNK